jgi:hypothetical protein
MTTATEPTTSSRPWVTSRTDRDLSWPDQIHRPTIIIHIPNAAQGRPAHAADTKVHAMFVHSVPVVAYSSVHSMAAATKAATRRRIRPEAR